MLINRSLTVAALRTYVTYASEPRPTPLSHDRKGGIP